MSSRKRSGRFLSLAALSTLVAASACATKQNPDLQQLRSRYEGERAHLDQLAPVASDDARVAIDRMAGAVNSDADKGEIDHLRYLASRRIDVAEARANERSATDEVTQLSAQRHEIELASRDSAMREAQGAARAAQDSAAAERSRAQDLEARTRALQAQLSELQARETDRGLVLTLGDVLFDVDRASLKPGAQASLEKLVAFLAQNPERTVQIEGHTDNTGSREHNEDLSQERASAVASFLLGRGVAQNRIETRGLAFDRPIATNDTAAGRQLNRRVEIIISNTPTARSTSSSVSQAGLPTARTN